MKKAVSILVFILVCLVIISCASVQEVSVDDISDISVEDVFSEVSSEISVESAEENESSEASDFEEQISEEETVAPDKTQQALLALSEAFTAENVFVYDLNNESFLFEKGTDVNIIPASVTKLLTALYALETAPVDMTVTPSDELFLLNPYSSVAGLKFEHTFTLEQLIAAMLLPSGNDAAYTVAAATARYKENDPYLNGKEALDSFISAMNEYARGIGCTGTVFTVPDGLAGDEHYTTAHDLVIIAKHALENPVIAKYMAMPEYSFTSVSGHSFTWKNTNAHLNSASPYHSACVTGMKTGTLGKYSVMVSADISGNTYIIGIFDAPSHDARYIDSYKIITALTEATQ